MGLWLSESITGIMVAVNGMLATNALDNTDNHTTNMKVNQGSQFVILIARFDRYANMYNTHLAVSLIDYFSRRLLTYVLL
jgi:hypothetical protein